MDSLQDALSALPTLPEISSVRVWFSRTAMMMATRLVPDTLAATGAGTNGHQLLAADDVGEDAQAADGDVPGVVVADRLDLGEAGFGGVLRPPPPSWWGDASGSRSSLVHLLYDDEQAGHDHEHGTPRGVVHHRLPPRQARITTTGKTISHTMRTH